MHACAYFYTHPSNNMLYPKEDKETKQLMYAVSSLDHLAVCMVVHGVYRYYSTFIRLQFVDF